MNIWGPARNLARISYGLEIGIVGTDGVIDIEDTHRDIVLATTQEIGGGYVSGGISTTLTCGFHDLPAR